MTEVPTLQLVGGPTALITYGGLRVLTDPTFDPPGDYPRPGTPVVLHKLVGPAVALDDVLPVDVVLISHDHHSDNLDNSGREMLSEAGAVLTTGPAPSGWAAERQGSSRGTRCRWRATAALRSRSRPSVPTTVRQRWPPSTAR